MINLCLTILRQQGLLLSFIVPPLAIVSCASVPLPTPHQTIKNIPGPEDVIVDYSSSPISLLISSSDRRFGKKPGAIYRYFPSTGKLIELCRVADSKEVTSFNPHGIDLVRGSDGALRLYVVSHRSKIDPNYMKSKDQILVYRIRGNTLIFESCPSRSAHKKTLDEPNDLVGTPDGKIYVSNSKGRTVAIYSPLLSKNDRWKLVKTGLSYTNGVFLEKGDLYCAGLAGKIVKFSQIGINCDSPPKKFTTLSGALDNFNPSPSFRKDSTVLISSHANPLRFRLHKVFSQLDSPTRIFTFSLNEPNKIREIVMVTGAPLPINGGSVATIINGELYIGQALGNYVLRLKKDEWKTLTYRR